MKNAIQLILKTTFLLVVSIFILNGCSSGDGTTTASNPNNPLHPVLQSIAITPINPVVHLGSSLQFTATGTYSDNTTEDITSQVIWTSSAPNVATISNIIGSKGLVSVLAIGYTDIQATIGGIVSNSQTLTVNSPSTLIGTYKDVGTNMDWWNDSNLSLTNVMSTKVNSGNLGALEPLVDVLPLGVSTVSWAFAVGDCTLETWAGISPENFAAPNVNSFVAANVNYILSTGGAGGGFTCSSAEGMKAFLDRYNSKNLVGIDFDIEGGFLSVNQINDLVSSITTVKNTYESYSSLKVSFTLATIAGIDGSSINAEGKNVMSAIESYGLQNYYINLMVMDYTGQGQANSYACVVEDGLCEMGKSAIKAAYNFAESYNFPLTRLELTPLLGVNDIPDEIFTIDDATMVANWAESNNLHAIHYWSFDRDTGCSPYTPTESLKTVCNGIDDAGSFAFVNAFISGLAANNNLSH